MDGVPWGVGCLTYHDNLCGYMTHKTALDLVREASAGIEELSPDQVENELATGTALFDVRESEELQQQGRIEGSIHAPRGMIEFYADASLPYYKPKFDKNKRIILHCASGNRSALAVAALKQMGYENIAHLCGGMKAWKEAGKTVVE